jgi:hypothetical protein
MKKNSGFIYQWTDKNGNIQIGIAYHIEQKPAFSNYKKVFLRMVDPLFQPLLDANGKKLIALKHITELTMIGCID